VTVLAKAFVRGEHFGDLFRKVQDFWVAVCTIFRRSGLGIWAAAVTPRGSELAVLYHP
jgi:hypothetical protein